MDSIHNPMGGKGKREEGVEREKEVWVPLNTHIYIYIYIPRVVCLAAGGSLPLTYLWYTPSPARHLYWKYFRIIFVYEFLNFLKNGTAIKNRK